MEYSEKNVNEECFFVRKPRGLIFPLIISGMICSLFFSALIVLLIVYPNDTADTGVVLTFIAFILLGFFCIFCGFCLKRWKIHIDGNQIHYTPYIGGVREFTFDMISMVRSTSDPRWAAGISEIKVYTGDKIIFSVGRSSRGFDLLLSRLNNENISFL